MNVYFPRLSFIGGARYRQGEQEYFGSVDDLPDEAMIDGKRVGDMSQRAQRRAKTVSDKADAKPQAPFDEAALRVKIEEEVRSDNDFLDKIRAELRQEPALRDEIRAELEPEVKKKLEDAAVAAKPTTTETKPVEVDPFKATAKK